MKKILLSIILAFFVSMSLEVFAGNGIDGEIGSSGHSGAEGKSGGIGINFIPSGATAVWPYFFAIQQCDTERVQNLMQQGLDINSRMGGINSFQELTAFHFALENNCLQIIDLMISNPDESNRPNLRLPLLNFDGAPTNVYQLVLLGSRSDSPDRAVRTQSVAMLQLILSYDIDAKSIERESSYALALLFHPNNPYLTYQNNIASKQLIESRIRSLTQNNKYESISEK